MNKFLVSLTAVLTTVAAFAGECASGDTCGKAKRQRIIYITAAEPEMYGDPVFQDIVIPDAEPVNAPAVTPVVEPVAEPVTESAAVVLPEPRLVVPRAYIGARVGVHMPSWKNKYSAKPDSVVIDPDADHDDYIFEPVFGGGIFAGRHFGESWRGDVEFGYMTEFSDSDAGFTFKLSTPYLMANAYYDFFGGFYLGAGVGFAFPKASLDWEWFSSNSADETRLSFIGGLSMGFARALSETMVLDVRYRIAGFYGPEWTRTAKAGNPLGLDTFETRVGFVLDNSISIGVRYEF